MTQQERAEHIIKLQIQSAKDRAKQAGVTAMYQERERLMVYSLKVAMDHMNLVLLSGLNPNMYLPGKE